MEERVNLDIKLYPEDQIIVNQSLGLAPFVLIETDMEQTEKLSSGPDGDLVIVLKLTAGGGIPMGGIREIMQLAIDTIDTSDDPVLRSDDY